jgi:hypothetical protein
MKKIIFIAILICKILCLGYSQVRLQKNVLFSGDLTNEQSKHYSVIGFIPYKNEFLVINANNKFVLGTKLTNTYQYSNDSRFGSTSGNVSELSNKQLNYKYTIDRIDPLTSKTVSIPILEEFDGVVLEYLNYLIKGDAVKIFYCSNNKRKKTNFVFCTEIDMQTNKTNTQKIFEVKTKGEGIKASYLRCFKNETNNTIAFVDLREMKKNVAFDFVVKDFDLNIIDFADNIKVNNIVSNDIINFILCLNNEIVMNTTNSFKMKGIFKKSLEVNEIIIIKDKKVKKLNLSVAPYYNNVKLLKSPTGEPIILMNYGQSKNKNDGIYISGIDLANGELSNKNTISFSSLPKPKNNVEIEKILAENSNEKIKDRKLTKQIKKQDRDIASANNIITDIGYSPDGQLYLLQEMFNEYTVTETRTTRTGSGAISSSTTRTKTYYQYGPGIVHCFDSKTNEHLGFVKINYLFTTKDQDPGYGIRIIPGNDKRVFVKTLKNEYSRYNLDNSIAEYETGYENTKGGIFRALLSLFKKSEKSEWDYYNLYSVNGKIFGLKRTAKKIELNEIILN